MAETPHTTWLEGSADMPVLNVELLALIQASGGAKEDLGKLLEEAKNVLAAQQASEEVTSITTYLEARKFLAENSTRFQKAVGKITERSRDAGQPMSTALTDFADALDNGTVTLEDEAELATAADAIHERVTREVQEKKNAWINGDPDAPEGSIEQKGQKGLAAEIKEKADAFYAAHSQFIDEFAGAIVARDSGRMARCAVALRKTANEDIANGLREFIDLFTDLDTIDRLEGGIEDPRRKDFNLSVKALGDFAIPVTLNVVIGKRLLDRDEVQMGAGTINEEEKLNFSKLQEVDQEAKLQKQQKRQLDKAVQILAASKVVEELEAKIASDGGILEQWMAEKGLDLDEIEVCLDQAQEDKSASQAAYEEAKAQLTKKVGKVKEEREASAKSERNVSRRTTAVRIGVAVLILGLAGGGGFFAGRAGNNNSKESEEHAALSGKLETCETDKGTLTSEKEELESTIEELRAEEARLKAELETLSNNPTPNAEDQAAASQCAADLARVRGKLSKVEAGTRTLLRNADVKRGIGDGFITVPKGITHLQ